MFEQLEFFLEFLFITLKLLALGIAQGGEDPDRRPHQFLMALHSTRLIYTNFYKSTLVLVR